MDRCRGGKPDRCFSHCHHALRPRLGRRFCDVYPTCKKRRPGPSVWRYRVRLLSTRGSVGPTNLSATLSPSVGAGVPLLWLAPVRDETGGDFFLRRWPVGCVCDPGEAIAIRPCARDYLCVRAESLPVAHEGRDRVRIA